MSKTKILFIGNSATYVNDIPEALSRLATKAGYEVECAMVVKGGATLSTHANIETALGRAAFEAIEKGFDTVFLQDNGNCISNDAIRRRHKENGSAGGYIFPSSLRLR